MTKKKENNGPAISHKDNATLTAYFRSVLADFDEETIRLILRKF
jgi:hypothetical protein